MSDGRNAAARVGDEALRAELAEAAASHLPDWPQPLTPHVLRHFCASQRPPLPGVARADPVPVTIRFGTSHPLIAVSVRNS